MANVYVDSSTGSNTSPFDTKVKAATTLAGALAVAVGGDSVWVSKNHNEASGASITLTSAGTVSAPVNIYCVDFSGSTPPVSADLTTGAIVSPNAAGNFNVTFAGFAYYQGIAFKTGSGVNSPFFQFLTVAGWLYFKNCAFVKLGTSSNSGLRFGAVSVAQKVVFDNTTWQAGNTADGIIALCDFVWKNTASAIAGATLPTNLFTSLSASNGVTLCQGVDFSALGAGKTLVAALGNPRKFIFEDCRLGASVTVAATPTGPGGAETTVIRCDNSSASPPNVRHEKYQYMGTQTVETTITRTGGATDGNQLISWKIVTPATGPFWTLPFESIPISFWNDSTSSMQVTVFGNFTSVPNDDDIWMEIEYLGASTHPLGTILTTTKADNLAASGATNNTSDTSTWGAGANTAFKITSPAFTPAQKGPINITIKAAKASSTFYIDPKPIVTGVSTPKSYIAGPGVYVNERFGGMPSARLQLGA